jgi:endonuclease-3
MISNYTKVLSIMERQLSKASVPYVTEVSNRLKDPFKVLVSCILSLRTKDEVTAKASEALFKIADTPSRILKLGASKIAKIIYPVGFYHNKAKTLCDISQMIIDKYGGSVPSSKEELLSLNGVGLKTANLVLGLAFNIPAICVDTHVHRISNRLGWVDTKTPYDTEAELKRIIKKSWWIKLNTILVAFGRNICLPVSPWCSKCKVKSYCRRAAVTRSR